MMYLRRRLRRVAVLWLLCQAGAVVATPILLHAAPPTAAVGDEDACCPGIAPGQVCPMHHTKAGARHCAMRSACGSSDAALLTLAGVMAPPPVSTDPSAIRISEPLALPVAVPLARSIRPESPPPRA